MASAGNNAGSSTSGTSENASTGPAVARGTGNGSGSGSGAGTAEEGTAPTGVAGRAAGTGGTGAGSENRALLCNVVVDVRGLGNFERDMTSYIYNEQGQQLWPDAALIRGVSSQLVNEGNLHTYITSEADISNFNNVTRVRATRIQPNHMSPNSKFYTDATLDAAASAQFRSAGQACRVVYLYSR